MSAELADGPARSAARRVFERTVGWIVPERNPQGVMYGILLVGSVIAATSTQPTTPVEDIGATVIALLVYWLAHSYAFAMGDLFETGNPVTSKRVMWSLGHEWAMVRGAAFPIVVMIIAALLGASALWVEYDGMIAALVSLMTFLVLAGVRAGMSRAGLIVQALVAAGFGLMIGSLRVLLLQH